MATYEITTEHVHDHVMRTQTPSGHTVEMDSSPEPGGEGATPVEMLLASAGACSLIDVVNILEKKKAKFEDLRVEIEAERREENPRRFTAIDLTYTVEGDVEPKALEQACELSVEKYCSVLDTIRASPDVSWQATVD
jgi:putative redox protein